MPYDFNINGLDLYDVHLYLPISGSWFCDLITTDQYTSVEQSLGVNPGTGLPRSPASIGLAVGMIVPLQLGSMTLRGQVVTAGVWKGAFRIRLTGAFGPQAAPLNALAANAQPVGYGPRVVIPVGFNQAMAGDIATYILQQSIIPVTLSPDSDPVLQTTLVSQFWLQNESCSVALTRLVDWLNDQGASAMPGAGTGSGEWVWRAKLDGTIYVGDADNVSSGSLQWPTPVQMTAVTLLDWHPEQSVAVFGVSDLSLLPGQDVVFADDSLFSIVGRASAVDYRINTGRMRMKVVFGAVMSDSVSP